MDPIELVEDAVTPRLQRLDLVVDERLVDKGLTCVIADLRGANEPRIAPASGRALSHRE